MKVSTTHIHVRYCETDAMGIAHHSHYANWLEVARIQLLEDLGCPYAGIEAQGFYCPVLELNVQYKRPVRFHDALVIESHIPSAPKARFQVDYKIFRNNELIATATTLHCFITRDYKPVPPPEGFLRALESGA